MLISSLSVAHFSLHNDDFVVIVVVVVVFFDVTLSLSMSLLNTAGKKLIIFEKVWITETRGKVYIAEHICQVSMVYDYPRQMRETQ